MEEGSSSYGPCCVRGHLKHKSANLAEGSISPRIAAQPGYEDKISLKP